MPIFAWQAWQLELPHRWDPVKLEGNFDSGHALLMDTHGPRLGLRWKKRPRGKRFDPVQWVAKAMREEVGRLAAEEARPFTNRAGGAGGVADKDPGPPRPGGRSGY